MSRKSGTRNDNLSIVLSDEDRIAKEDKARSERDKLIVNYFLIVSFGCVMATAGALVGFMYPGLIL